MGLVDPRAAPIFTEAAPRPAPTTIAAAWLSPCVSCRNPCSVLVIPFKRAELMNLRPLRLKYSDRRTILRSGAQAGDDLANTIYIQIATGHRTAIRMGILKCREFVHKYAVRREHPNGGCGVRGRTRSDDDLRFSIPINIAEGDRSAIEAARGVKRLP